MNCKIEGPAKVKITRFLGTRDSVASLLHVPPRGRGIGDME